ncbi:FmdB family zinc ribbon protein [Deinococcus budaensis]|uniref:Putative FmdB family regulatory protein n=1 Tax=Deinococcus budaensis TaxID=1665626 RepID=A0A7W8GHD9_9DEIO|nr:FmdB family zinc ribbon protein [Deinococcus budaensis]MBB5235707.1 putative FmdB family regulatory protein [Deinococcus budaensis]
MPTYVYKNIETGETYEFKQSMRDDALTVHPETGAPIKRVLSQPGIAFRGSGFYVTDSRPRGAGEGGGSGGGGE